MLESNLVMVLLSDEQRKHWSARLHNARIVGPADEERLVVMNSIVQLVDVDSGMRETFKLVFPEEANIREGKLSVLAPMGTSLLSCRIGDAIVWQTEDGVRRLCVDAIQLPPSPGATKGTLIGNHR